MSATCITCVVLGSFFGIIQGGVFPLMPKWLFGLDLHDDHWYSFLMPAYDPITWIQDFLLGSNHCFYAISIVKIIILPASMKLKGGYTVLISCCPSVRLSIHPSVNRIVSALYLQQYLLDPFHIYTSYPTTSEGMSCESFCKIHEFKNLAFFFFNL